MCRHKPLRVLASALALVALLPTTVNASRPAMFAQQEVIAVFLFNFAHFVTWPESAFAGPDDPLCYCVAADHPVAALLTTVIRDETVGNHPLILRLLNDLDDLSFCHVVFVGDLGRRRSAEIVGRTRDQPLLTVGDTEEFASRGGMITLVSRGKRLRPIINKRAVDGAGLRISSKLLQVAIVQES